MRAAFPVDCYDLDITLSSGQAFRWQKRDDAWEGVIDSRWVRLSAGQNGIIAETAEPVADWSWLEHYLQLRIDLVKIIDSFPGDEPMQAAVRACTGLRLLRQDPWECLASFICSSTKQIVQIQQIVRLLCERFGSPISMRAGQMEARSFPTFSRLASASEAQLRECKLGFRAPYLLGAARMLSERKIDLNRISNLPLEQARGELMAFPGVGPKIADCVLLFAYGFQQAFPVDVWIMRAMRQLYFAKRPVKLPRLRHFTQTHFGPNAGYAQQYLFHYMREARVGS